MQFKHFIKLKLNSVKIQNSDDPCGEGVTGRDTGQEGALGILVILRSLMWILVK